jgi:hypothetical protein
VLKVFVAKSGCRTNPLVWCGILNPIKWVLFPDALRRSGSGFFPLNTLWACPSVVSMLLCRLSRRYFLSGQGKKMLHSRSYGTVF